MFAPIRALAFFVSATANQLRSDSDSGVGLARSANYWRLVSFEEYKMVELWALKKKAFIRSTNLFELTVVPC